MGLLMPQLTKPGTLVRYKGFGFSPRSIRNALHRDRQALAAKRRDFSLFCGVRQLARIERWLQAAEGSATSEVELPAGPTAEEIGFAPAVFRWFDRLITERRYCQFHCASCDSEYQKSQMTARTRKWQGIRVRGHGPTGAGWKKWQCCPRGHEIFPMGFKIS